MSSIKEIPPQSNLDQLEKQAETRGLILRIKESRPINLWSIRVVVAEQLTLGKIKILGELKAWAYSGEKGLQLDTMKVLPGVSPGVGDLLWSATMAWALEKTPCTKARLLAIRDEENYHKKLIRYFQRKGFKKIKDIGSSPLDLFLRTIWGGSGALMIGECNIVLKRSYEAWLTANKNIKPKLN